MRLSFWYQTTAHGWGGVPKKQIHAPIACIARSTSPMEPHRTQRLEQGLSACSLTPRSARAFILQGAPSPPPTACGDDLFYTEAKGALRAGDFSTAKELLEHCEKGHERSHIYRTQIHCYEILCARGVVPRAATRGLREILSRALDEQVESQVVCQYAEKLLREGYNESIFGSLRPVEMLDALDFVGVRHGHRARMLALADTNLEWWERLERKMDSSWASAIRTCWAPIAKHVAKKALAAQTEDEKE